MFRNLFKSNKFFLPLLLGTILISTILLMNCSNTQDQVITPDNNQVGAVFSKSNPEIQAVMAVQNRHIKEIMSNSNIVGVGTGLNSEGKPAIIVYSKYELTDKSKRAQLLGNIPNTLEGKPVEIIYSGVIKAFTLNKRYNPCYIGVSVGNNLECAAGTFGCIVEKDGINYILSNNHVLARENSASLEEEIVQPGRYDNKPKCANHGDADVIATLSEFENIDFDGNNTIDAAIAKINDNRTCYFYTHSKFNVSPSSTTVSAEIDMKIKKVGRTTELTTGTVTSINWTGNIDYGNGNVARFVNQIYTSRRFCSSGDSGSLVVTNNSNNNPIGLLFAGSSNGAAILNPIDDVLDYFGVTIVSQ